MANLLFDELIRWTSDSKSYSLAEILLKAKVFASELRSRKFKQWIDREVNGYESRKDLPKYRVIGTHLFGDFNGYFGARIRNKLIPLDFLNGEPLQFYLGNAFITESVSTLEGFLTSESSSFEVPISGQEIEYLRQSGPQIDDFILNAASKRITRQAFVGLLHSVRSRLLDFLLDLRDEYPDLSKNSEAHKEVPESIVETAFERTVYQNCVIHQGDQMGDTYQANQVGAMGRNAKAKDMTFNQILRGAIGEVSLGELAAELEKLRLTLLAESRTEEQDAAVLAVANAEEAAKKGNAQGVVSFLKRAGTWALDKATNLGLSVLVKAIEAAMKSESPPEN